MSHAAAAPQLVHSGYTYRYIYTLVLILILHSSCRLLLRPSHTVLLWHGVLMMAMITTPQATTRRCCQTNNATGQAVMHSKRQGPETRTRQQLRSTEGDTGASFPSHHPHDSHTHTLPRPLHGWAVKEHIKNTIRRESQDDSPCFEGRRCRAPRGRRSTP